MTLERRLRVGECVLSVALGKGDETSGQHFACSPRQSCKTQRKATSVSIGRHKLFMFIRHVSIVEWGGLECECGQVTEHHHQFSQRQLQREFQEQKQKTVRARNSNNNKHNDTMHKGNSNEGGEQELSWQSEQEGKRAWAVTAEKKKIIVFFKACLLCCSRFLLSLNFQVDVEEKSPITGFAR